MSFSSKTKVFCIDSLIFLPSHGAAQQQTYTELMPSLGFSIHENEMIWIFVKCLQDGKIQPIAWIEYTSSSKHAFLARTFFFFPSCCAFCTSLWNSFSPGAWLILIFSSSSLPKQDSFFLHFFFVLCGICNTLAALYHLWIPFFLVVFSLSVKHLEWCSFLFCCCCNWTWCLKGGEKAGINCSDNSALGLSELFLRYQSLDQSSAMLSQFVWGELIPGTFGLVESQMPELVTGKGAHCILLPLSDMSKSLWRLMFQGLLVP